MPRAVGVGLSLLLAFGVGLLGLALSFTDLGPTSTPEARILSSLVLYLAGGLPIGFLHPGGRGWMLAGLAGWGHALLGGTGLWLWLRSPASGAPGLAAAFLLVPATLALAGGWAGSRARRAVGGRVSRRAEGGG